MHRMLATIVTLSVLPGLAHADGLIYQLPEDGHWVRFDLSGEQYTVDGKLSNTSTGTMTVRSVGRETVNEEACRWIEIETIGKLKSVLREEETDQAWVMRLLLPEKNLKRGVNAAVDVKRAVLKKTVERNTRLIEVDLQGEHKHMRESLEEAFLVPEEIAKLDPQVVENSLGKLECERLKGRKTIVEGVNEIIYLVEARLHEKAPFGVVAYELEMQRTANNQLVSKRRISLKFAASGTGAKLAIGETKQSP